MEHTDTAPAVTSLPFGGDMVKAARRALFRAYHPGRFRADRARARRLLAAIDAAYDEASTSPEEALKRLSTYEADFSRAVERHRARVAERPCSALLPVVHNIETSAEGNAMTLARHAAPTDFRPAPAIEADCAGEEDFGAVIRLAHAAFLECRNACAPAVEQGARSAFI